MPDTIKRPDLGRSEITVVGGRVAIITSIPNLPRPNSFNAPLTQRFMADQGVCVGDPAGGDMGPGNLNVEGSIYVNGQTSPNIGNTTWVTDTAPAAPKPGDLWFNSTTANTFIYYNDGTSAQWVSLIQVSNTWAAVTQAQYDALSPPSPTTLYVIVG